jgi:hypothetical protein
LNDATQTMQRFIGLKRRRRAREARMAQRAEHVLTLNRLRIVRPQPSHTRSTVASASSAGVTQAAQTGAISRWVSA